MDIRFLTSNEHKIREVAQILEPHGIHIVPVSAKIEEIQTEDVCRLVRDKVVKAFEQIGRPVFVEHTGLHLEGLNGLPGGLTQVFWDTLQADSFAKLVSGLASRSAIAKTVIGYCDARTIRYFEGQVVGTVPDAPRGPRDFQWDCVFVPDGYSQTFAELGSAKNEFSMRRVALDRFAASVGGGHHGSST
jgi:XTP/dITP diphosphohydrolase